MSESGKKEISVKTAAKYVLKSTFMVTHAQSTAERISRSYNNIKGMLQPADDIGGDYPEDKFTVDKKGRLIPNEYDDIIKFQAAKITAREMIDYIKNLPEGADKESPEIIKMAGNKMLARMDELRKKAKRSAKTFRIAARTLGWGGLFTLAVIITFLVNGKLVVLFAVPSAALMIAASFRYAMRAAIHAEGRLYSPAQFVGKFGRIGWIFR